MLDFNKSHTFDLFYLLLTARLDEMTLPTPINGISPAKGASSKSNENTISSNSERLSTERSCELLGFHEAFRLAGQHMVDNVDRVIQQNPTLGRGILESFGTNLAGSTLSYREFAMNTIAMLTAIGDTKDQLNVYVEAALRNGATVEEILDLLKQSMSFVGAPKAVNALRGLWPLLSEHMTPLPQTYTERVVRVDDHDTLIRDTGGPGVPVILIHALSLDGRMWREVMPALAANGTRVIAYDLRGHGYARASPLVRSLEHLCSDLDIILQKLEIPQADVYGASYGGAVAQYYALDYPHRVRSLAVLATAAKAMPVLGTRATRAEQDGMDSLVAESIIRWFLPETIAENSWCVRYARGCVRRARVEDWAAAWRAMAALDCIDRLHELQTPVLSLSGKQDLSSTPPMMRAIVDACKSERAEFQEIDPGTHMMVMEQPGPVANALNAFRRKVDM